MEVAKRATLKLTGKEYQLLRDAVTLIDDIVEKIDTDDFGEDYNLRDAKDILYAFLDDPNVYVEWAD